MFSFTENNSVLPIVAAILGVLTLIVSTAVVGILVCKQIKRQVMMKFLNVFFSCRLISYVVCMKHLCYNKLFSLII